MGIGIGVLWICAIVIMTATFRARYATPAWTIAVRYGMLLAVLGAGTGAFMTAPSHAQLASAKQTHQMPLSGSHTIGAPDGGKGLPLLGWSTQYGDVRPAHFAGLHALQIFALLVYVLNRLRVREEKAGRLTAVAVAGYGGVFLILLLEALLRKPLVAHDAIVLTAWVSWLGLSMVAFLFVLRGSGRQNLGDGVPLRSAS